MAQRLQKFLAERGVASRRKCEEFIKRGEISVNGVVVTHPGTKVYPDKDEIVFKGKIIRELSFVCWAVNKPVGVVCSCSDDRKYKKITDLVRESKSQRLYPAGRLDVDSEGLVLLTNDGDLCYRITHPKFNVKKLYLVDIDGEITPSEINKIKNGVLIDNDYKAKLTVKETVPAKNGVRMLLELNEGKNREIRKVFEALGKKILLLRRLQIGAISLGNLKYGEYRLVTKEEIESILNPK